MIGTRTTALILAMSLLAAAPSVAVKVFADDTIIQASNQEIEPSNSAQINQPGDGGVRNAEISHENNAANDDLQVVLDDNNNDIATTLTQASNQAIEPSNTAQIDQSGDDGERNAIIGQENNAANKHIQEKCKGQAAIRSCLILALPPQDG